MTSAAGPARGLARGAGGDRPARGADSGAGTAVGNGTDAGPHGGATTGDSTSAEGHRAEEAGGPRGRRPAAAPSTPWAIVRLAVVLAVIVAVFLALGLGPLLVFIGALVAIVVLHELGHYLAAKWSHMKVTEFFIGFGPRLWSVRRGETDYGIKPILAGAYVKIPGMTNLEEVDPADEPRTYRRQPFSRRIIVASAGSFMHGLIAFALAWVAVVSFGVPHAAVTVSSFPRWSGHTETAAEQAGLRPGDRILSVDGRSVTTSAQLAQDVEASDGRPVTLVVERAGHRSAVTVVPQAGHYTNASETKEVLGPGTASGPTKTRWLIGVSSEVGQVFTSEGPVRGIGTAGSDVGRIATEELTGLAHAFSPGGLTSLFHQVTNPTAASKAAANPASSNRITSVVGAARLATQAEQRGVFYFLEILIALNIVLGIVNMLPMLPLDGGHVAIAIYERIRTRRGRPYYQADAAKLLPVAYAFMAVLLVIVGSAVFLDIAHPIANPFG